jgi:asparagine synthase (glutamine-hydrolysing)
VAAQGRDAALSARRHPVPPENGFVTPIAAWFRGPLADSARAIVRDGVLARTGWFDMNAIAALIDAHQSAG